MKRELWQKILSELSSWTPPAPITLCLYGAGEPLLHPELKDILKEAIKIPHLRVGFMTNAMLLKKEVAQFLVDLPIAWLAFSVDGVNPNINDAIRRGAKLKIVEKNIEQLIYYKTKKNSSFPELTFNMVAYPSISPEDEKNFVSRWAPYATQIMVSRFRPIPSKRLLTEEEKNKIKDHPCPLPFRQLVVAWDGRVGLCCEDIFIEIQIGDSRQEPLINIFNNRVIKKIRNWHQKGQKTKIPLCRECDVWAAEDLLREEVINLNGIYLKVTERPSGKVYIPNPS